VSNNRYRQRWTPADIDRRSFPGRARRSACRRHRSFGTKRPDQRIAVQWVTPTADTNESGSRRISADQQKRSAQSMDGAGHPERILQAEDREDEPNRERAAYSALSTGG